MVSLRSCGQAKISLTPEPGSLLSSFNKTAKVATLSGRFSKITLPPGSHNLVITQGQETRKISKAFLVLKPVRLIIANFYGNNPDRVADQGFDDHIEGSANAIKPRYDDDNADEFVVRVSSTLTTAVPKKGDIDALSELKDYALKSKKDGGLGIQKRSVISVDSLGHGSPAVEPLESGIYVTVMDPDNAMNILEVHVEVPPANIRDGGLEDSVYAGYFVELIAESRQVDFNLWHCFVASKVGQQKSQIERLAEAFGKLGRRVILQGPRGFCTFPSEARKLLLPDGTTRDEGVQYFKPITDREGMDKAESP